MVKFFCVCFAILYSSYSAAQQDLIFKNYSVESGLVSNTVWSIGQDGQGYMWFGTRNGLSRFDGYEFKSYQFSSNSPHSLGNNFIHSFLTYDKDHVWLGTSRGIYTLDLRTEKFSRFKNLGNVIVNDMQEDKEKNIWIVTSGGLFKYDRDKNDIVHMAPALSRLRKIAFDNEGNLWIATAGRGIIFYNPTTQKTKIILTKKLVSLVLLPSQFLPIRKGGSGQEALVEG